MSNAAKTRKFFSVKNFRGLDKENKPSLVSPFRASDGLNFRIDEDVLKTRPSFVHAPLGLYLDDGDFIVDFYKFRNYMVYVTNTTVYLEDEGVFEEVTSVAFDHLGKKPIFAEDKDCLFIFGLGKIYVLSITTTGYVFYDLIDKPSDSEYEDLPSVYVPTVMVGDNSLDDVNLLSNQVKYRIFAGAAEGDRIKKSLPTHYDPEKHGGVDFDITFYEGTFDDVTVFPVFAGIHKEDFDLDGTVNNSGSPVSIKTVFHPEKDFVSLNTTPDETVVEATYGMTKEWLFNAIVDDEYETDVFTYLIDYLETLDTSSWTENKYFEFEVPVRYSHILRDETTDFVVSVEKRTGTVSVYVELRKFLDFIATFREQHMYMGSAFESEPSVIDVIPLPSPDPTAVDQVITVDDIDFTSVDEPVWGQQNEIFVGADLVPELPDDPDAGDKVKIAEPNFWADLGYSTTSAGGFEIPHGTYDPLIWLEANKPAWKYIEGQTAYLYYSSGYYWNFEVREHRFYEAFSDFVWAVDADNFVFSELIDVVFDNGTSYPTEKNIRLHVKTHFLDSVKELLSITTEPSGSAGDMYYNNTDEKMYAHNGLEWVEYDGPDLIYSFLDVETSKTELYYFDGILLSKLSDKKIKHSGIIKYYSVPDGKTYYHQFTLVSVYNIPEDFPLLIDGLYSVEFNQRNNTFDLSIRDFFFDYHGEPSISVVATFENNPDYTKISGCSFGATFGSENRLFLAGNSEYPNIDRYNVSNDLLGDNVKSQSYELTYFPSKNYRVLGGKAAINGYVVATDNLLYVTKADYPNDSKLFIRERILDENGVVGYREYKTNISKTPLNEKCIVRFNNDVLMLTKDGLYAVELSQNVMTDERLLRMRSGFINKDLKSNVNLVSFMIEDNDKLYIAAGNYLYVADSRFFYATEDIEVGSNSYEIVKWTIPDDFRQGSFIDGVAHFLSSQKDLYILGEKDYDEIVRHSGSDKFHLHSVTAELGNIVLFDDDDVIDEEMCADYVFRFTSDNLIKTIGVLGTHYSHSGSKITVLDASSFRDVHDGVTIYGLDSSDDWIPLVVSGYDDSEHLTFNCETAYTKFAIKTNDIDLYIQAILTSDTAKGYLFDIYKPEEILEISAGTWEAAYDGISESLTSLVKMQSLTGSNNDVDIDDIIIEQSDIEMTWKSAVLSLGNDIVEKTMFKAFFNVIKTGRNNRLFFGRRTMRSLDWSKTYEVSLANPMDFSMVEFGEFGLSTMQENTISIPAKENNFVYIQFLFIAIGQVELDGFSVLFKENRYVKSIG
jgi:hypothetical protein